MGFDEIIQHIDFVIRAADANSNEKVSADLGCAESWLVKNAAKNGLCIGGFHHTIDNYFVKHAFKGHGNKKQEKLRGQVAITINDIRNIPYVLQEPDFLVYGAKNAIKNDIIIFVKNQSDGSTLFVEEVRSGRNELAGNTIYKMSGTSDAYTLSRHPTLYARNDTSTIKIIDVKREIVKK